MPASGHRSFRFPTAFVLSDLVAAVALVSAPPARAQEVDRIRPVHRRGTGEPEPDECLMWRRTLDGWGF